MKSEPKLVADGHKLVVYIPLELRDRLQRAAYERAFGQKGYMSLGAVVRELLEERLDDGDPLPRGKKPSYKARLEVVPNPTPSVESETEGTQAAA